MMPAGVVVIGRNEGERLRRCLQSIDRAVAIVYVDSGSSDGSPALAQSLGAHVVALDMTRPFTAARARNAGLRRLRELAPTTQLVQFVDGDCELVPGWLDAAQAFLQQHADVAAVAGRLRERYPNRSIYNLLCDMEWDVPAGEARAVGGNAMLRIEALLEAGGYRDDLIAGEEPELCVRLRRAGWRVWRLADDMGWHDAAMTRFGQWWCRAVRNGHAFAEGSLLHGAPPERHYVPEARRALLWGLALPAVTLLLVLLDGDGWWLLLLAYPAQMLRLMLRHGIEDAAQRWRSVFLVLARFPEGQGVFTFWLHRLREQRAAAIEYK